MRQFISVLIIGAIVASSCNSTATRDKETAMRAQQFTIDSMKNEIAKQHVVDSMNEVAAAEKKEAEKTVRTHTRTRTVYVNNGGGASNSASASGETVSSHSGYAQE